MSLTTAQSIHGSRSPQVMLDLTLILLLALVVRLVTYNGAFGSDDLTYFQRAAELARGEWTSANYNGALRYGFNLPAAGFIALFGESLFVANLWPLACSLIEISAVYMFASAVMNRRAGAYAALLLASAPLHIAVATRIHADPVVSMFVTVGYVLLYFGALRRRPMLLFAAGLSIGCIFWTKELAAVTWFAFLPMLWFFSRAMAQLPLRHRRGRVDDDVAWVIDAVDCWRPSALGQGCSGCHEEEFYRWSATRRQWSCVLPPLSVY